MDRIKKRNAFPLAHFDEQQSRYDESRKRIEAKTGTTGNKDDGETTQSRHENVQDMPRKKNKATGMQPTNAFAPAIPPLLKDSGTSSMPGVESARWQPQGRREGSSKDLTLPVANSEPPKKKAKGALQAVTALKDSYESPGRAGSPRTATGIPARPGRAIAESAQKEKKALTTPLRLGQLHRPSTPAITKAPSESTKASTSAAVTPPSARAVDLFRSLRTDKKVHGAEQVEVKPLSESVPVLPSFAQDWDVDDKGQVPDDWSPRKKKGGHIVMGLASRAAGLLSGAQTSHTLWLHSISRRLREQEPIELEVLAKLVQPSMRLRVLECFSFGLAVVTAPDNASGGGGFASRRDDRRIALAQCRLLLQIPGSTRGSQGDEERDSTLDGLVLFSLHDNASATTQPPLIQPRRAQHRGQGDNGKRQLFVPTTPHDMRFVEQGAEMWVFEPFREVALCGKGTRADGRLSRGNEIQQEAGKDRAEVDKDRNVTSQKALICCRFGVVV